MSPSVAHVLCLVVVAFGSGASCGHTSAAGAGTPARRASTEASPSPKRAVVSVPEPPPSATIGDAMADHFLIASWARDAVIAGTIEPLREPLTALADYRYDDLRPGVWLPWIAQLQAAARLTASAENLDAAAMGVATMTRLCGECHRANGAGPKVVPNLPAIERSEREDLSGRMFRHIWGATLLWEGLVSPSDEAWEQGARELRSAPAELDERLPAEFDADLREVVDLGTAASEAATLEERADVYGLVLATCAGCHDRWIEHGF